MEKVVQLWIFIAKAGKIHPRESQYHVVLIVESGKILFCINNMNKKDTNNLKEETSKLLTVDTL